MSPAAPGNVLVIMADQLAAGCLPVYGGPSARTPHLDALARDAAVFDAAYCAFPLCAPSRAALLTGRRASRVGVFDNAAELAASTPTLMHHLRAEGFHTALSGKMHFVGPDQLHGFEQRLTTDVYPAGVDWTPDWTRDLGDPLPWYHTMESVLTPARCVASMQTDYDDEVAFHAVRHLHDLARDARDQPFLFVASFTNPHDPWEIPSRYWDLYDPREIPPPKVASIPIHAADPHSRRLRAMCGVDEIALTEDQIRHARHAYLAATSYVDERIGTILDALRATGLDRDTTVIFTADHGEFLGERGLWYKMSFLQPSARVPLLIRRPGSSGRRIADPVSLIDIAPTVLELTQGRDAAAGADFDGTSLVGLMDGGRREHDHPVICEYHAEGVTAPAAMIRQGTRKLIVCETDPDLLYDLDADPLERENLAARPEHEAGVADLRALLEARLDLGSIHARVLESQRARHLVTRALSRGLPTAWDFRPDSESRMRYVRTRADLYDLQRQSRLEVDGGAGVAAGPDAGVLPPLTGS